MTLALDASVDEAWLQEFTRGLAEDQQLFDLHLMGGDTVKTPGPLTLSLTAIGTVPRGTALRRHGAKPGDRIFTTGTIGDGHLGLQVLRHRFLELGHDHRQFLADRYHLPEPRLEFGQALCRRHLASAGLDISDGLVADLGHLATASGCAAILHSHAVPLSSAAAELVAQEPALMMALITGGDDYEILFTAAADKTGEIQALAQSCHCRVTEIGECVEGAGVQVVDRDGQTIPLAQTGYSHF
jgi:thiamine-monophosphate kinase